MPSSTGTPDLTVELARRLKAARALSGKKVRELADDLGWSAEKLYRLERGEQVPDALELAAIAAATDQRIGFLFGEAPSSLPGETPTLSGPTVAVKDRAA